MDTAVYSQMLSFKFSGMTRKQKDVHCATEFPGVSLTDTSAFVMHQCMIGLVKNLNSREKSCLLHLLIPDKANMLVLFKIQKELILYFEALKIPINCREGC